MVVTKIYRPVSLLSVVSEVFGKLAYSRLFEHLDKLGLFSSQWISDLPTIFYNRTARAFKRSDPTRAIAFQISKAFDRF